MENNARYILLPRISTLVLLAIAIAALYSPQLYVKCFSAAAETPLWCATSAVAGPAYGAVFFLSYEGGVISAVIIWYVLLSMITWLFNLLRERKSTIIAVLTAASFAAVLIISLTLIFWPYNFRSADFYDPTATVWQETQLSIKGEDIFNNEVDMPLYRYSRVNYGYYHITAKNRLFEKAFRLYGNNFMDGNHTAGKKALLMPNYNNTILKKEEIGYVRNYVHDYVAYNDLLLEEDKGFPKQYYLYGKDMILSTGEMVFLLCEEEAYLYSGIEPVYFLPKNATYEISSTAIPNQTCYSRSLYGMIPGQTDGKRTEDHVLDVLGFKDNDIEDNDSIAFNELNSHWRKKQIAFTFDIESGRYLPAFTLTNHSVSPCEADVYSWGLEADEKQCNSADIIAWMTPATGEQDYTQYPYPWSSGILGYKEILSYPDRYGIPVTNFYVTRDLEVFDELAPEVIERTNKLVGKGLLEVGANGRYHSNYFQLNTEAAYEETSEVKRLLEERFGVEVTGFRAPYLTTLQRDLRRHLKMLSETGYMYYTQEGKAWNIYGVQHKPYNYPYYLAYSTPEELKAVIEEQPYLITLDHPWNIVYNETIIDGEYYLFENSSIADNEKAMIFTAMNSGLIPTLAKDIAVTWDDIIEYKKSYGQ